jgi:hypothetical protein
MRNLSRSILLSAVVALPFVAMACSDDPDEDNPGASGSGGSGTGGSAGSKASGGTAGSSGGSKASGGTAGKGSGGSAGSSGGSDATGGEGGDTGNPPIDCELSGDIADDLTVVTGSVCTLDGPTRVLAGATLTIEHGVTIKGAGPTSVLLVRPGGMINAVGTADSPIVFTSSKAPGQRAPGDWGGVIILGNARTNQAVGTSKPLIEGVIEAEPYGSNTDANNGESSGTLQYVRIEFVGRDIDGQGNETNGLTMGGVGSGTTIDHVMVSNSIDDCFEWFGGAVNASYLIALNCDDDMFDTDHGFSGKVQFAFGRQYETSSEKDSNGFEMDTSDNANINPPTTAQWSNVTLCGANEATPPANPRIGMVLRRQLSGSIINAIVSGFGSGALSVRNLTANPPTNVTLTSSLVFGNPGGLYHSATHDATGPTWFEDQSGNVDDGATIPAGFDCGTSADVPLPVPDSAVAGVAPSGFPDESANYKGAFGAENWMTGAWVSWDVD